MFFLICSIIQCVCVFILFYITEKQRSRIKEFAEKAETYKLVAEEAERMRRDLKEKVSESCGKEMLIQREGHGKRNQHSEVAYAKGDRT